MLEFVSGSEYPKRVIPLIDKAKSTIDIIVFDWRWYPQDPGALCQLFNQAILRAAIRGVQIRAVANNDEIINILKNNKCQAKRLKTKKLVHTKLINIDGQYTITGSHNFTQAAFQMNLELSVIIDEAVETEKARQFFANIWAQ